MKEIMEAIYPYISYIYYGFQALAILDFGLEKQATATGTGI